MSLKRKQEKKKKNHGRKVYTVFKGKKKNSKAYSIKQQTRRYAREKLKTKGKSSYQKTLSFSYSC